MTRIPAHGRVALRWTDGAGEGHLVVASLIDASVGGRRIRCRETLDVDSELELEEERGKRLRAKVRWVAREGEEVEAGLGVPEAASVGASEAGESPNESPGG